MPNHTAFKYDC